MNIISRGVVEMVTSEVFIKPKLVGSVIQENPFTRQVTWVLESTTQFLYLHGGKVIREGAEYNDYYGYLASVKTSVEEAEIYAKEYGITAESSLILVARTTVKSIPYLAVPESQQGNLPKGAKAYTRVPGDWTQKNTGDANFPYSRPEPRLVIEQDIWSTKNSADENEKLVEKLHLALQR